jgi:hypothetical protein
MPQYLLTVTRKRRWMFQAIEIDGEPYWDGGYSGNPTITPLIRECESPLTDEPSVTATGRVRQDEAWTIIVLKVNAGSSLRPSRAPDRGSSARRFARVPGLSAERVACTKRKTVTIGGQRHPEGQRIFGLRGWADPISPVAVAVWCSTTQSASLW